MRTVQDVVTAAPKSVSRAFLLRSSHGQGAGRTQRLGAVARAGMGHKEKFMSAAATVRTCAVGSAHNTSAESLSRT